MRYSRPSSSRTCSLASLIQLFTTFDSVMSNPSRAFSQAAAQPRCSGSMEYGECRILQAMSCSEPYQGIAPRGRSNPLGESNVGSFRVGDFLRVFSGGRLSPKVAVSFAETDHRRTACGGQQKCGTEQRYCSVAVLGPPFCEWRWSVSAKLTATFGESRPPEKPVSEPTSFSGNDFRLLRPVRRRSYSTAFRRREVVRQIDGIEW